MTDARTAAARATILPATITREGVGFYGKGRVNDLDESSRSDWRNTCHASPGRSAKSVESSKGWTARMDDHTQSRESMEGQSDLSQNWSKVVRLTPCISFRYRLQLVVTVNNKAGVQPSALDSTGKEVSYEQ